MYYECDICNKIFTAKQSYTRHITNNNIHKKYKEDILSYNCDCGNKYLYRSNLYAHKKTCNYINSKQYITPNPNYIEHTEYADKNTILDILLKERQQFEIERQQFQQKEEQLERDKDELLKQVELEKQNVELEKQNVKTEKNRNTIETQNNTNNNLNIQINAFGCENLEYITDKFKIKCLNQIYKSIPEMVAKIHFNTKYPENHNVKIPNKKLPQASIMTNDHTWKTVDKKTAISSIVGKSFEILDETFEEHKDKLTEHKRHNYVKYQDQFNKNDKELHKRIETEVEYMVVDKTRR